MTMLSPGDTFPSLTLRQPGGGSFTIPDDFKDSYAVVLFYRGSWCPYCNAQLRAFQRAASSLAGVGAKVVAVSVDDEPATAALIAKHGLSFPVGHSADAAAISAATGAFTDPARGYLQSTGFVLDPAGRVIVSVYSSGAIGRLVPDDVVGLIRYAREHAAAASSSS
jgi:peroxiredoxin